MINSTATYYEVKCAGGYTGKDGKYAWDTEREAIAVAVEFKKDPRSHNPQMSDENVKYWQSKDYTVIRKTVVLEEIITI